MRKSRQQAIADLRQALGQAERAEA
jgi:hypothetical protein